MKKQVLEFIEYYFEQLNVYLENTAEKLSYKDINSVEEERIYADNFQLIEKHRLNIPNILKNFFITDKDLNTYLYHNDIIKYVGDLYQQYGIKKQEKTSSEILRTFVSNEIKIDKNFRKVVSNFQKFLDSNSINDLYNLAYLDFDLEKKSRLDNKRSLFIKVFKNSLQNVDKSKKAELFSQLNVFIEEYSSTDLGRKHLELIKKNYQEELKQSLDEKDKELATLNWIKDILSAYNNCTPTTSNILIENSKMKVEKADGGIFDSLFFINTTKIPQELKKSFDSIDTIDKFNQFKRNIDNISQYQISATSDKGFRIESSSVVKHSLSSAIINKILNLYYIETKDNQFTQLFSQNDNKDVRFNSNITGALNTAIKHVLKDLDIVKKEFDTPENFLRHIQQEINSNPLSYIDYLNKKYDNVIITNTHFDDKFVDLLDKDFQKFENLEDRLREDMFIDKEKNLFSNKSIICFYREEIGYRTEGIIIDTTNVDKKFEELTTTDFMLLLQFNAIVKSSNYGKDSFDFKTTEELTDRFMEVRGIGIRFKYNNELISKAKMQDIDTMMVDTFILGSHAKENLESIKNNQDMDNFLQAITLYASNKEEHLKKEIYEKIVDFSENIVRLRVALNKENNFHFIKNDLAYINSLKEERELRKKAEEKTIKAEENTILNGIKMIIKFKASKEQFQEFLNESLETFIQLKENNIKNIIELVKSSKKQSFIESLNDFLEKNHFIKNNVEFPEIFKKVDIVCKEIQQYIEDKQHQQNKKHNKHSEEENSSKFIDKLKSVINENITDEQTLLLIKDRLIDSGICLTPDVSKMLNNINFNQQIKNINTLNIKL